MIQTIAILFYTWILTYTLHFAVWPYLAKYTPKYLIDSSWGFSRIIGWILVSYLTWVIAHLGIPANSSIGIFTILLLLLIASTWFSYRNLKLIIKKIKSNRALIITQELLFLVGFFFLGIIRSYKPEILDLEKFMDVGFMATYLRSPTLPAPDMWLAGETINYYSFGHFMGAVMTQIWGIELAVSYNTLLALIMGMSLMLSFSVAVNLLSATVVKLKTLPLILSGLIASISVNLAGNSHAPWYYLSNKSFDGYWYPNATRFIENTIHEFPSYSYVVSDLHAHVWGLPIVFLQIMLGFVWFASILKRAKPAWICIISGLNGLLLGIILTTNAWDFPIYGLLIALAGLTLFILDWKRLWLLVASALIMLASATLASAPWWLNFDSISEGIEMVSEGSPLWQLLVLWTGHVIFTLVAVTTGLTLILKKKKQWLTRLWFIIPMALTAWVLLVLPEIIYVKDIYTGHPRANTMFKLTYQSFIIMSLLGGWSLGALWSGSKIPNWGRMLGSTIVTLVLIGTSLYPYQAYKGYYGFQQHQGLDGYQWLQNQHPYDYAAIVWLNRTVSGQPVILEAVGESYTTHNRISAYTGLPTVLGWRVHQWLWRGGFDIPDQRTGEVKTIFESPSSQQSQALLNTYQVEYIIIGDKERETYEAIDEAGLIALGEVVFESGTTYIIRR